MTMLHERLGRRTVIAGLGAGGAAAAMPAVAARAVAGATSASPAAQTLATIAQEVLQLAPATATLLGVDTGVNAGLRARLDDASPEGREAWSREMDLIRVRLGKLDRSRMTPRERLQVATVDYAAARGQEAARFSYGRGAQDGWAGGTAPYVVSQQDGAVTAVPEFLNANHPVATAADAEAYVARVNAFGRLLDQETAQIREDAARGVVPPAFIAEKALGQLQDYRKVAPARQPLVLSLARKTAAAGVTGDYAARAAQALEAVVYPALDRQIAVFREASAKAGTDPSVARLPNGDAYYALALRLGTTTEIPARTIHETGLRQNEEIKARIDTILRGQGLTKGTVGQRVVALNSDPRFLFPDTDQGRADLIAYIRGKITATRALTPRISHLGLKAPVDVVRVPPDIQEGAALGYMNFASLDGRRPAIYYVNLKSTSLWPKYQLASLSAHEAIPGHAWQGAYLAEHRSEIPLVSSLIGFNAFVEGWALYAEQLMDEQGLYRNDPFGRVGYLQAQQFRACRLVADTGLHALGWSRDKAIDFMVAETGKGRDAMTSEIDRYCASPGQACGYKVGHNEILRLRADAQRRLGKRFDLGNFDDTLVATGGVPLSLLPQVIDELVAAGGRRV